jgi:hypothetical protein
MTFLGIARRPSHGRRNRVRPVLEILESRTLLSVIYSESTSGDLSNNQAEPTPLTLALGTNSVVGTVGTGENQDWVTVHVPAGLTLSSLVLASYVSSDSQGFIGVQKGTSFTGNPETASPYLGYAHFGTGASNGSQFKNLVGMDLLPIMGNTSLAAGSQGFTAPLASGDYTFLIQQLGASTSYQFDFVTAAPPLKSIAVTPANPSIVKGQTRQFTATGTFSDNSTQDVTSQVTWASATTSVATISGAGLASAIGAGTSTISAKLGTITGSTLLTVTAATVQHFAITAPSSTPAGSPLSITVTAQDAGNATVAGYTGTVHFAKTDSAAGSVLPADYTFTASDNGVHVFTNSVTLVTAGVQTITATDASAAASGHADVTVTPLAANHLKVVAPSVAVAGAPLSFTVTALDQYNNSVGAAYTGTVHFSSTDASATEPTDATLTQGSGIFTATLKAPGAQTVSATDTVRPGLTGTSGAIAVSATATQFAVAAPATVTAGSPFLVTVTAQDAGGHTASGYSGTVQLTSTDPQAVLVPASATLTDGVGTFLVTLKTVHGSPWTISAKDTQVATLTGTSNAIAVTPGAASFFTVLAPAGAETTGAPFNVTVTAMDAYGNVASGYSGQVHFTSSDAKAVLPSDAKLSSGVGTFSVTLNSQGSQTITATDNALTNPILTGTSGAITARGLTVSSLTPSARGFTAVFSKPFVPANLSIYGTGSKTADVTLVGAHVGPISGSLLVDPSNTSVTFNATANSLLALFDSPVLPDDTYTVTLVSGSGNSGFLDALGAGLDGGGTGGHANYTTTFTTSFQADKTPVLALPDFARGPDSGPASSSGGESLPVTLYNASSVTDATFTLSYNPSLLTVTDTSLADASGTGTKTLSLMSSTNSDATHASATFHYTNTASQSGTLVLGDILVSVPTSAGSIYKAKELLQLGTITVNSAAFTGAAANGVHVNAYFGDVTGNGTIDGLDVATANNVSQGKDTGFAAYPLLDPAIIGDVANDISVDAGDVSTLAAFNSHLPTSQIPPIPTGITITPVGADPTLSLAQERMKDEGGRMNQLNDPTHPSSFILQPSISVVLDDPHPLGSTGMTEAVLALTFDPSVLKLSADDITLGSIPGLNNSWRLATAIDLGTGRAAITLYSTTPLTSAEAGSLVDIDFHVVPGASAPTGVRLVNSVIVDGTQFVTQVDDAQGQLVLSPGADRLDVQPSVAATAFVVLDGNNVQGAPTLARRAIAFQSSASDTLETGAALETSGTIAANNDLSDLDRTAPHAATAEFTLTGSLPALDKAIGTITIALVGLSNGDLKSLQSMVGQGDLEQITPERLLPNLTQSGQVRVTRDAFRWFETDFSDGMDLDWLAASRNSRADAMGQPAPGGQTATATAVDNLFTRWTDDCDALSFGDF